MILFYIFQLNVKRAQERRKPDVIESVNQPFNPASFNFLKIKLPEILLELVKEDDSKPNNQVNQTQQNGTDKQEVKVANLGF
jgi:hypothetical protein